MPIVSRVHCVPFRHMGNLCSELQSELLGRWTKTLKEFRYGKCDVLWYSSVL